MSVEVPERNLPAGTVTFLFTDIEGSTSLLKQLNESYAFLLADQREILRAAFEKWDGREIDTQGDAFFASFPRATQAVVAVVEIQRALAAHDWPSGVEVRVRMGLHTGEPWLVEEGYVGMDVHRAARIAHVGHGGQVLLSETTAGLLKRDLAEGTRLKELGEYQLKDLRTTWHIYQLVIDDLPAEFPALKAKLVKPPAEAARPKPAALPAFLAEDAQDTTVEAPVFVSRQVELEKLDGFLEEALSGQGRVVFVSGGPGRGKTALINHFARLSMEKYSDLLVISGSCDAYTGSGDPYRPFRAALDMLAGDLESRWAAGGLTTNQARRLWDVGPITAAAIMEGGKDLLGTFFNPTDLSKRAESGGLTDQDWYLELQTFIDEAPPTGSGSGKAGLLEQVARVLRSVAETRPLILTLDDLQWADRASLDLLVHLGRELTGVRMLILGAYRPEEVALGRDGGRHPLEKVLSEFKRGYGEVSISLTEEAGMDGRDFIDAFLDTEPNQLSDDFRKALYKQTAGHPLFTIELLREMQARGDLVRDEGNSWIAGPALDWNVLPARVEGVIEERIGRLEEALQETLTIASVEGEDFTAQVVARVQQVKDQGIIRQLSRELDKKHHLVGEQGSQKIGATRMHRYRFQHSLFQQHLYNGLTENEKEFLHADVGAVLEELYGESREQIASQLAWHFAGAGQEDKAIEYLLVAGNQARAIYAYIEASQYYEQAVAFLKGEKDFYRTARAMLKLGQTYHSIPDYRKAQRAFREGFSLWESARERPTTTDLPRAPHPLRIPQYYHLRNIDPGICEYVEEYIVINQLFSGMIELSLEGDLMPAVAQSWDVQDNGKKYTFHLRGDVYWSDGSPVEAEDFEFAWRRSTAQDLIRTIWVEDEVTLHVDLVQPTSHFLNLLSSNPHYYPVPRKVVEKYGDAWTRPENIVSNGPYVLESWESEESLVLKRNPFYFDHFPGNVTQVEIQVGLSWAEIAGLYESDQIDILMNVEQTIEYLRRQSPDDLIVVPSSITFYLAFNTSQEPFNHPFVRQALAMAIDKERLVTEVHKGLYSPAYGGLLPLNFPGHQSEIGLPFDPQRARQYLAQAGYPGGRGSPDIALGTSEAREYLARYLCEQWRNNLNLDINLETKLTYNERFNYPLFINGWSADYPDPATFLIDAFKFTGTFPGEKYKRMAEQAAQTLDTQERIKLFQEAERVLIDEAIVIPLFYWTQNVMLKPWVKLNTPPNLLMDLKINFRDVIIEPH